MGSFAFAFDKVYIIESLDATKEALTGKQLYDDLLKRKEWQLTNFKAELCQVDNRKEFHNLLDEIRIDCVENGTIPMLHFEIHGCADKSGLILNSRDVIEWESLCEKLRKINEVIGNHLFITLAVCHGAYLMQTIKPNLAAPFWGFIGSFKVITVFDLMIRYEKFYDEFLTSFDLDKAVDRLHQANPELPSSYEFINSEQVFINVMKRYFATKFSKEEIRDRFSEGIQGYQTNRSQRRQKEREFKKALLRGRRKTFNENRIKFFMHDQFPENRKRFKVEYNDVKKYSFGA